MAKLRGLLVRLDASLRFVPASVALRVTSAPRLTVVVGAPPELLGITLFSGAVIPVLALGDVRAEMIVCQCVGEVVGVVGGRVLEAGAFDVVGERPDRVAFRDETAAVLDVPALYASVHAAALARPRSA